MDIMSDVNPDGFLMVVPNQNINTLTLCSLIEKDKLIGTNFLDWHRNLRITLKYEGKFHRTDSPLSDPPAMDATPEHFTTYQYLLVEKDKVALLILTCMTPELQKEMENHNAYDMNNELKNMFQTQVSQELYDS
ncbi:hypothetical protein Tco_1243030 [Tanacetum coccineum]